MVGGTEAGYQLVVDCMRELKIRPEQLGDADTRIALGDLMVERGGMVSIIGRTLRLRAKKEAAPSPDG